MARILNEVSFPLHTFCSLESNGGFSGTLISEQLDALRGLDSPTVSNAIEHVGVRGRADGFAGWEGEVLEFLRKPGLTVEALRQFQERFTH